MEWIKVLIEALVVLSSSGLFFYTINRKLKKLDVNDKEIEIVRKQDDEWQELYREERARVQELEKMLSEERSKKEKQDRQCRMLELTNQQLNWYRCTVNGCQNRRPPHVFDKDGNELEAVD